jgi:hypothetical protein
VNQVATTLPTNTTTSGAIAECSVGDSVEVWSSTVQTWCPGVIQKRDATGLLQAEFTVPDGRSIQKSLPPNHPEIRLLKEKSSLGYPGTSLPAPIIGTTTIGTTPMGIPQAQVSDGVQTGVRLTPTRIL